MTRLVPTPRIASRLPREQRVADIMAAARRVFAEKGYEDASVAEIAARAGVVEGSVFRYFENKRVLLVKVVEDWYESMFVDFDEHLAMIEGTWKRLRFLVWKHLSNVQKEPALSRLVFEVLRPGPDYRKTSVFDLNRRYTRRTLDILRDGIATGTIRADANLTLTRDMIYGGVEHHTWAFLRGEGTFSVDAAADGIMDLVRGGLTVSADPPADPLTSLERTARRLELVASRLEKDGSDVPKSPRRKSR